MFNFDLADKEGKLIKAARGTYKAANLVQSMLKYQTDFAAKNPDYIDAPFITNHDMGRVANALRNDPDDLKMAGGLLMTLSGNPFVYYGERDWYVQRQNQRTRIRDCLYMVRYGYSWNDQR